MRSEVAKVAFLECWYHATFKERALAMIEIKWQPHPSHQMRIRCLQHTSMEEEAPMEGELIRRPFLVDRDNLQPVPLVAATVVKLDHMGGSRSAVVHLKRLSD